MVNPKIFGQFHAFLRFKQMELTYNKFFEIGFKIP